MALLLGWAAEVFVMGLVMNKARRMRRVVRLMIRECLEDLEKERAGRLSAARVRRAVEGVKFSGSLGYIGDFFEAGVVAGLDSGDGEFDGNFVGDFNEDAEVFGECLEHGEEISAGADDA